jgi:hypothetical protein
LNKRKKPLFQFKKTGTAVKYVGKCEMKFNAEFAELRRGKNAEGKKFLVEKIKTFISNLCVYSLRTLRALRYVLFSIRAVVAAVAKRVAFSKD